MVMSYTAIPHQDRTQLNNKTNNGNIQSSVMHHNHHHHTTTATSYNNSNNNNNSNNKNNRNSSLIIKSPNSIPRRSSLSANNANMLIHTSNTIGSPPEQEIYEGFTFFQEQQRNKKPILNCPFLYWNNLCNCNKNCYDNPNNMNCCFCEPLLTSTSCLNRLFQFSNAGLERIYQKYFTILYQSSLLSRFLLLITLISFVLGLMELIPLFIMKNNIIDNSNSNNRLILPNIKCWLLLGLGILSTIPLCHMHTQCCMRPNHLGFIKFYTFLLCCLFVVAILPIWITKNSNSPLVMTMGLWEILLLIMMLSSLFPLSLYSLIGISCLFFFSHSITVVLISITSSSPSAVSVVMSTSTSTMTLATQTLSTITSSSSSSLFDTFKQPLTSIHWMLLSCNWIMFMATLLIGGVLNYFQQRMLRNSFLHTREFLNHCVDAKIASEKLDRLLSCVAPPPIVPELRQSFLSDTLHNPPSPCTLSDIIATSSSSNNSPPVSPNNGPSVVHLRNISFLSVTITGLSQLPLHTTTTTPTSTTQQGGQSQPDCDGDSNISGSHHHGNGGISTNHNDVSADAIKLMNELFSRFDMLGQELGCYRIRADPDEYLSLAGYPETRVDHARSCVELGFRIQQTVRQLMDSAGVGLQIRCAIHTGTIYGTVMGQARSLFDLLGDDIRAIRQLVMASQHGKVLVSKSTFDQLPDEYKGDTGPRVDVPLTTTGSSSVSGEHNPTGSPTNSRILETLYLRPRHTKQNSLIVGDLNGLQDDKDSNSTQMTRLTLTDYPLVSGTGEVSGPTQPQALTKLAQHAKFNVNTPYYFLHDDSFFLSPSSGAFEDRLFLDLGHHHPPGGLVANTIVVSGNQGSAGNSSVNPGSPVYLGTNKSNSITWKSTLRSQMTQSLIGSHQIEESVVMDNQSNDNIDLTVSKFTGIFQDPRVEKKFQDSTESYMGVSLICCLFMVLLITSIHGLLMAKTVILLLLFLIVFMWIAVMLLVLMLAKMKCISSYFLRFRLCSSVILIITILGMFAVYASNSFCCNTASQSSLYSGATKNTTRPPLLSTPLPDTQHLDCPAPVYMPLTTLWVLLPLMIMFTVPSTVKITLLLSTFTVNCLIMFYTHGELFHQYNQLTNGSNVPIHYSLAIVLQLFLGALILMESRILNSFRRLEYQWSVKTNTKLQENQKLNGAIDEVISNLLPNSVSTQILNSSKHYMNLYSRQHRTIHVLSVCIPNWCPSHITEPGDVAAHIRQLNRVFGLFDQAIRLPECNPSNDNNVGNGNEQESSGIIKIRSSGETVWYGIGLDNNGTQDNNGKQKKNNDSMKRNPQKQALALLYAAEIIKKIIEDHNRKNPEYRFSLRIGIHSGTGYSGVIGGSKPQFGVWGEACVGASLIQRYSQYDKIHVSSQFFSELEPAYRDNFYDVGILNANYLGQIIPVSPNNNCRWNLRVLSLRDPQQMNSMSHQHQQPINTSLHAPTSNQSTSTTNNPLMVNSNLISLCSDDSVFPVTHFPSGHSPAARNSMSFSPSLTQQQQQQQQQNPAQDPYLQMMLNQSSYMVQSSLISSPPISSVTTNVIPPHNHMIPIQIPPSVASSSSNHQQPPISMATSGISSSNHIISPIINNTAPNNNNNNHHDMLMMMMTSNNNIGPHHHQFIDMVRSQGDFVTSNYCPSNNNNNKRNRIHRYKNLATELPNTIIPPSPPPHKRTYSEEISEPSSPPVIPPRNNRSKEKDRSNKMTQSELSERVITKTSGHVSNAAPPQRTNGGVQRSLTPSSSMDSFLELEKACCSQPRVKSAHYSAVPNSTNRGGTTHEAVNYQQRLSLIPESNYQYQQAQFSPECSMPTVPPITASSNGLKSTVSPNNVLTTSSDERNIFGGVDVMTTSDDRVFGNHGDCDDEDDVGCQGHHPHSRHHGNKMLLGVDNNDDITSHHNPIYTDNEYESMAESQMNLLDGNPDNRISVVMRSRGMVHEMSLDFPDYKRPESPPCPGNGDDSDHLSKRNRNSSNSRDSSSLNANNSNNNNNHSNSNPSVGNGAATNSGNGTSSDENSNMNHNYKEMGDDVQSLQIDKPIKNPSNHNQPHQSMLNKPPLCNNNGVITGPANTASNIGVAPDNASSCISLVTDLGWTSFDEQDYDDSELIENDASGAVLSNNNQYGYHGNKQQFSHGNRLLKQKNKKKCKNNRFGDDDDYDEDNDGDEDEDDDEIDEDESDIDAIRLHSDLISDYSENPLVSDLEDLTDTDISYQHSLLSSAADAASLGLSHEKLSSFYKFPANNRLNPRFYNDNRVFPDEMVPQNQSNGIFASHPWSGPGTNTSNSATNNEIYSQPILSNSSQVTDKDDSKKNKLPSIAPVKIPDFSGAASASSVNYRPPPYAGNQPAVLKKQNSGGCLPTSSNGTPSVASRIPIRRVVSNTNNHQPFNNKLPNRTNSNNVNVTHGNNSSTNHSDQSEYDNVSQSSKMALINNLNNNPSSTGQFAHKPINRNALIGSKLSRDVRSLDGNGSITKMNGEDSDAMSGYIGDVASSVYDSDDYEDRFDGKKLLFNQQNTNTSECIEDEEEDGDPMAQFFPRLPTSNQNEENDGYKQSIGGSRSSSCHGGSGSGGAIRSDYDNVNSDELPRKMKKEDLVEKQIAEEARKISQIYKKQWTHQGGESGRENSVSRQQSSSDDLLLDRSARETSAELLDEEESSWDSPDRNDHNMGQSDGELRCQSTDCVLTNNQNSSPEPSSNNDQKPMKADQKTIGTEMELNSEIKQHQQHQNHQKSSAAGLKKIQERAGKVRSLLPPELHPYVLPGCISNSSVNSSDYGIGQKNKISNSNCGGGGIPVYKASGNHQGAVLGARGASSRIRNEAHRQRRQNFSDDERSKRSV